MTGRFLTILLLCGMSCGVIELTGIDAPLRAQEKKKEKDPQEGKKGTILGILTKKGDNFIEVQADGEEKARKYVPLWKGGLPSAGGGPDKEVLKVIRELKVGSRLEVEWLFAERPRVIKVKVLKTAEK